MGYNQKALGLKIAAFRECNKLTQKELSKKSGVATSYIANIETGVGKTVGIIKLCSIANALNVELDDLLRDSLDKLNNNSSIKSSPEKVKILNEISTFTDAQIIHYYKLTLAFLSYKRMEFNNGGLK